VQHLNTDSVKRGLGKKGGRERGFESSYKGGKLAQSFSQRA